MSRSKLRSLRQGIIISLVTIIVCLFGLEAFLSVFDPWGMRYFDDLYILQPHLVDNHTRIYSLESGTYNMPTGFIAHELQNFLRAVPASQNGPCKVVFIGDSVTWGWGANDDQTWVNLVAAQLPGTTVLNPALNGYNIENIVGMPQDFPDARLFVYFIVDNDAQPSLHPVGVAPPPRISAISRYILYSMGRVTGQQPTENFGPFYSDLDQLVKDGRVVFISFDEPWSRTVLKKYKVWLIPNPGKPISIVDGHQNVAGQKEMAISILPFVKDAVSQKCGQSQVSF